MEENLFKIDLFHSPSSNALKNWIYIQALGWYRCRHDDPEFFNEGVAGYELVYTLAGRGWIEVNNKRSILPPNSLGLFSTSSRFGIGPVKDEIWEFLYVDFGWKGFYNLYETITGKRNVFLSLHNEVIEKEFRDLYSMKKNEAIGFELAAFQKILTILTLLHDFDNSSLSSWDNTGKYHHEVEEIIEYIRNHYSAPVYAAELSNMVGYSKDYVSKIFKRETGYSITEFAIKCRLEAAKALLLNSACTIKEISIKTGFENPSYFNSLFREKTGMTPAEFRRKKFFR